MNDPVPSLSTPPVAEAAPEPLNPFFRITIFAGGLFVITILAMIASALGPSSLSSTRAAFDENAGWLLTAEVLAILTSAFFAMAGDQGNTHEQATDSTDENEPVHPEAD
ncbi:MAG TPA: hypothetical protein DCE47_12880 [Planctomycetaceae bacterium]|nr:hypothetical protein [Planctomycetaceae bacterium]HCD00684.1 hypothetical protein [Planctomycetaceae bacterium]|tara:strand:+ start:1287 stop:1613 length:327 start_codon:yes stop_codon:yes gene_type:complete